MKKKIFLFLLLIISIFITGCKKVDETGSSTSHVVKETKEEYIQEIEEKEMKNEETIKGKIGDIMFEQTEKTTNTVKIEMENNNVIIIELDPKNAPITVKNFQKLVSEKFYDGIVFHRIVKDFMIQGGDPTGTGTGGSSETIKGEFKSNGVKNNLSHTRGVISMARSNDYDSASSQFFIVHQDSTFLDGNYASFGKVIAGMDVVDALAETEVVSNGYEKSLPVEKPVIKSIRFVEVKEA